MNMPEIKIDPDWRPPSDKVLICPYCMNEVFGKLECCGESSGHFAKVDRVKWENGDDDLEMEY